MKKKIVFSLMAITSLMLMIFSGCDFGGCQIHGCEMQKDGF